MPLRCLLFTTDEAMVEPIWQALARLGVEGEHCKNPVDAVERVTTQLFQIVITDWQDQPEAAFLLKTARDLKASSRPLTLAIVGEESRSFALQAGANSVLLKPLRPEQVGDTLSTACQLLQSKLQSSAAKEAQQAAPAGRPGPSVGRPGSGISTAGTGIAAAPAPAPAAMVQGPEKLRAGEFLQSSGPTPGAQFDTESEGPQSSEVAPAPVNALTELEPMAAAVQENPEAKPDPKQAQKDALTGWAALQARLTKARPAPTEEAPPKNDLVGYGLPRASVPEATAAMEQEKTPMWAPAQKIEPKADLHQQQPEEFEESSAVTRAAHPKRANRIAVGLLAAAAVVLAAVPRTRQIMQMLYHHGLRETVRWLNPPPAPLPQAVTVHDSFGQPDDEYKLPAVGNIPDATTDPSQIQVLPVVDPTAKVKAADANGQTQTIAGQTLMPGEQAGGSGQNAAPDQNAPGAGHAGQTPQNQPAIQGKEQVAPTAGTAPAVSVAVPTTAPVATTGQSPPAAPEHQPNPQPAAPMPAAQSNPAPASRPALASQLAGIPASLRSQVASSTPDMSGTKPADVAMSSIQPVTLSEAAVRQLLTQTVEPEYPAAAKGSGLAGSVVLQVSIAPEGSVQDAKFLQGSFIFARAAIDAVKQWRFKPYGMNGRAVAVESVITLNFKPPPS
jgi:periplasmic protein TonB